MACAYFPDGRRAAKTVSVCSNGVWSVKRRLEYCWDGWKLAAELERGPAGGIAAVRHFIWGLDVEGQASGQLDTGAEGVGGLVLIREWRAETGAVKRYLPVTDGLGSVCGLVDADTAELAAEYDYSPYGEVIAEVGPAKDACPFRHRTRYYDSETWLYYYGYRYYDPSVTKWISKDPLGEAGGWNLTAFCGNDPVNTFDPLGLAAYLFDGTWVDKDDQKNPVESNVARLWKNYGGTVWYREGVGCGNRVGGIRGFFSKVFGGFGGAGWDSRLEWMYKKLEQTYVDDSDPENKQIDIFGFSRGAGMARDFANMIKERGIMYKGKWVYPEIRFLGVFDTVASSGLPGNDINPGKELSLPDNVLSAAHALSGHEVRGAFPLTLFADDPRVDQQWFSGVHSDTGGAYGAGRVQGYIPLYWMYTKAWEAGVPLGAFPQDYYSAIMRYRFRYDLDWNELWSSDKGQLSVAPFHDSTDSWLYWPDKAKRGIRGALGGERYKRRTYVH